MRKKFLLSKSEKPIMMRLHDLKDASLHPVRNSMSKCNETKQSCLAMTLSHDWKGMCAGFHFRLRCQESQYPKRDFTSGVNRPLL